MIMSGYREANYWHEVRSMPITDCTVTGSSYNKHEYHWDINIYYNYSVNGTNYSGMTVSERGGKYFHRAEAESTASSFYPGREMLVRYDPVSPEISRLKYHEYDDSALVILLGYCAVLGAPFIGGFYFRDRVRKWMEDE